MTATVLQFPKQISKPVPKSEEQSKPRIIKTREVFSFQLNPKTRVRWYEDAPRERSFFYKGRLQRLRFPYVVYCVDEKLEAKNWRPNTMRVFLATQSVTGQHSMLYMCPMPNCLKKGDVCFGTNTGPVKDGTIDPIRAFWMSAFNHFLNDELERKYSYWRRASRKPGWTGWNPLNARWTQNPFTATVGHVNEDSQTDIYKSPLTAAFWRAMLFMTVSGAVQWAASQASPTLTMILMGISLAGLGMSAINFGMVFYYMCRRRLAPGIVQILVPTGDRTLPTTEDRP